MYHLDSSPECLSRYLCHAPRNDGMGWNLRKVSCEPADMQVSDSRLEVLTFFSFFFCFLIALRSASKALSASNLSTNLIPASIADAGVCSAGVCRSEAAIWERSNLVVLMGQALSTEVMRMPATSLRKAHEASSCCAAGRDADSSPSSFAQSFAYLPRRKQMLQ